MPEYNVTIDLQDAFGRKGRKIVQTRADMPNHADAVTAASAFVSDLADLTELEVIAFSVGLRTVYTDTPDAQANIDEGATFVVNKTDNYRAVHRIPGPVDSIKNQDGTIDVTDALVLTYFGNFLVGGDFTLSDGENIDAVLKGTLDK